MELELIRIVDDGRSTFGSLVYEGRPRWCTVEPSWNNNRIGLSCIPAGVYSCIPHVSPTHGDTLLVKNVPGRLAILVHPGNTAADTEGCILPGLRFSHVGGGWGVVESKKAHQELLRTFDGLPEIVLRIHPVAIVSGGPLPVPERH